MNRFHVCQNYYINIEGYNHTVEQKYMRKSSKDGVGVLEEAYKQLGFFRDTQGALRKIIKLKVDETDAKDVKELIKYLNRLEDEFIKKYEDVVK